MARHILESKGRVYIIVKGHIYIYIFQKIIKNCCFKEKKHLLVILRWAVSNNQILMWFKIGAVGTKHFIGNVKY